MVFHVITIFPQFFEGPFDYGVVARAKSNGLIGIETHDLRDHTFDRHRTGIRTAAAIDRPKRCRGGGPGARTCVANRLG